MKNGGLARSAALVVGLVVACFTALGSGPASADPDPRYVVAASWEGSTEETVYLRRGSWNGRTGWGLEKIEKYHNLNTAAVRTTTTYPGLVVHLGGTAHRFETPVEHVRCSGWWIFRKCRTLETVTVAVTVDFRRLPDRTTFGVVNAFCIGYNPRCPDWVKDAVNI